MPRITPNDLDVTAIRKGLNLTRPEFAELVNVNPATVWRWETIGVPDKGPARALLEKLRGELHGLAEPCKSV